MSVLQESNRATELASMINNVQTSANNNALIATQGILSAQSIVIDQNTMDIAALKGRCNFQSSLTSTNTAVITQLQTAQNTLITTVGDIVDNSTPLTVVESQRATAAETVLTNSVTSLNTSRTADELRITVCETSIASSVTSVNQERARALIAETNLQSCVNQEVQRAIAAEVVLTNSITSLNTSRTTDDQLLTAEVARAEAAETALSSRISNINISIPASTANDISLQNLTLSIGTTALTTNTIIGSGHLVTLQGNVNSTGTITDSNDQDGTFGTFWWSAFGGNNSDGSENVDNLQGNLRVQRQGKVVSLQLYPCGKTPTDASQPAIYEQLMFDWARPQQDVSCSILVMVNNYCTSGMLTVSTAGVVRIQPTDSTMWSGPGRSGIYSMTCCSYLVG